LAQLNISVLVVLQFLFDFATMATDGNVAVVVGDLEQITVRGSSRPRDPMAKMKILHLAVLLFMFFRTTHALYVGLCV
jgi:hypothetical protein